MLFVLRVVVVENIRMHHVKSVKHRNNENKRIVSVHGVLALFVVNQFNKKLRVSPYFQARQSIAFSRSIMINRKLSFIS